MKIWNRLVSTVYSLSGLCLVFFLLVAWATQKRFLHSGMNYVETNISTFGIISAIIVFMGIIWAVNWFDYLYKTKVVSFDNPDGKIKISLRAIENYVTSMLLKQVEGIQSIKIKTDVSPKGINTKINLKLSSQYNIPELCSHIQEITKNYLQDTVGIERISNIEIYISSIKGSEVLKESKEALPDEEEPLFSEEENGEEESREEDEEPRRE